MLDYIKLNEALSINSCSSLFEEKDYLLHTVSLIPYPVFVKKQNYSGHTPKLLKSEFLMKYVYDNFIKELINIENFKDIGANVNRVIQLEVNKENLINQIKENIDI